MPTTTPASSTVQSAKGDSFVNGVAVIRPDSSSSLRTLRTAPKVQTRNDVFAQFVFVGE